MLYNLMVPNFITLFRFIMMMFCGADSSVKNIPHIHTERRECYVEYCQSRETLVTDLNDVVLAGSRILPVV